MTQLPTAIREQIEKEAEECESSTPHTGLGPGIYMAGATSYAEKWQAAEEEKAILQEEIVMLKQEKMMLRNANLKAEEMMEKMEKAIKEIVQDWDEAKLNAMKRDKKIYGDHAIMKCVKDTLVEYDNYKKIKDSTLNG